MSKTIIEKPFGPWFVDTSKTRLIRRCEYPSTDYAAVDVHTFDLTIWVNNVKRYQGVSANLSVAIQIADEYIADNFEVAKTPEEKLKDAEARIAELEAKLASVPLTVGQKVRVIRVDDRWFKEELLIKDIRPWHGEDNYLLDKDNPADGGLYMRSEIEPVW